MVDSVHFRTDTIGWRDLGWKAMASNLSDVAAMGCAPTVALVTLGLRGDIDVDGLKAMYSGMMAACEAGGCAIVGGDIVRSETLFVTVALQGVAGPNATLPTRGAAVAGDALAVTGYLGSSAGGLRLLLSPEDSPSISLEAREYLTAAHNRPNPRTKAGQTLRRLGVRCAMDVSDGLVADVGKLCAASAVSASIEIDSVPVNPHLKEAFPNSWRDLALTGGEDYELVFTTDQATLRAVKNDLGDMVTVIGKIEPGDGSVRVEDGSGRSVRIEGTGWDHFAEVTWKKATVRIETDSPFRPSEIMGDLRIVAETLYHPMRLVGFWDAAANTHMCPETELGQSCPHGAPARTSWSRAVQPLDAAPQAGRRRGRVSSCQCQHVSQLRPIVPE